MPELKNIVTGLVFGESPRWRNGELFVSDVHAGRVVRVGDDGTTSTLVDVPGRPSGAGFLPTGEYVVVSAGDQALLIVAADGTVIERIDLADTARGMLNDMVVDSLGRCYIGDMGYHPGKGEEPTAGGILLVERGKQPRHVAQGLDLPNGIAVDDAGSLFIVESRANRVTKFTVAADGSLEDRTIFVDDSVFLDGLCLDAAGAWVAQPTAAQFVHYSWAGVQDAAIASPAPFAIACVIGGADRRTLFLSSADTDFQRIRQGDSVTRIDAVQLEAPGIGRP